MDELKLLLLLFLLFRHDSIAKSFIFYTVGFNHMFDINGCGLTSLGAEMLCMVYTTKGFVH